MTEMAIKNGQSRDVTRVGQSVDNLETYQSRVECTMTEVAIKNRQSRDVTGQGR